MCEGQDGLTCLFSCLRSENEIWMRCALAVWSGNVNENDCSNHKTHKNKKERQTSMYNLHSSAQFPKGTKNQGTLTEALYENTYPHLHKRASNNAMMQFIVKNVIIHSNFNIICISSPVGVESLEIWVFTVITHTHTDLK